MPLFKIVLLFLLFGSQIALASKRDASNNNATILSHHFLPQLRYEYITLEEHYQMIQHDGWYGLFRDVETLSFASLCIGKVFYSSYVPVSSIEAISSSSSQSTKAMKQIINQHLDDNLPFGNLWRYYWEMTAIGYASFNLYNNTTVTEQHLNRGKVLLHEFQNGSRDLTSFTDSWDKQVHRQLRDPVYGEISKLIWLELAIRYLMQGIISSKGKRNRSKFDGILMRLAQNYYFPIAHSISLSLQLISLVSFSLDWINALNSSSPHPLILQYSWKLNPRLIVPHVQYWVGSLFAPGNGLLYLLSRIFPRLSNLHRRFVFGCFIILGLNGLPITIDRFIVCLSNPQLYSFVSSLSVDSVVSSMSRTPHMLMDASTWTTFFYYPIALYTFLLDQTSWPVLNLIRKDEL